MDTPADDIARGSEGGGGGDNAPAQGSVGDVDIAMVTGKLRQPKLRFRVLFTRGVLAVRFLRTYRDAGKVKVTLESPSGDSEGGFTLACLREGLESGSGGSGGGGCVAVLDAWRPAVHSSEVAEEIIDFRSPRRKPRSPLGNSTGDGGSDGRYLESSATMEGATTAVAALPSSLSAVKEVASGYAIVSFELLPLSEAELRDRGGGKFKLTAVRSC